MRMIQREVSNYQNVPGNRRLRQDVEWNHFYFLHTKIHHFWFWGTANNGKQMDQTCSILWSETRVHQQHRSFISLLTCVFANTVILDKRQRHSLKWFALDHWHRELSYVSQKHITFWRRNILSKNLRRKYRVIDDLQHVKEIPYIAPNGNIKNGGSPSWYLTNDVKGRVRPSHQE